MIKEHKKDMIREEEERYDKRGWGETKTEMIREEEERLRNIW